MATGKIEVKDMSPLERLDWNTTSSMALLEQAFEIAMADSEAYIAANKLENSDDAPARLKLLVQVGTYTTVALRSLQQVKAIVDLLKEEDNDDVKPATT